MKFENFEIDKDDKLLDKAFTLSIQYSGEFSSDYGFIPDDEEKLLEGKGFVSGFKITRDGRFLFLEKVVLNTRYIIDIAKGYDIDDYD